MASDIIFLGIMTKRTVGHAQKFRRVRSDSLGGTQGSKQVLLFDLRHSGFKIQPFRGDLYDSLTARGYTCQGLRQVFHADSAAAVPAHRDRIFDCILEFAHVSGPGIVREKFQNVTIEI